jgi:branched-subunit amino acid ABC-type transport system permease component
MELILMTLGIIFLIESLIFLIFKKESIRFCRMIAKSPKKLGKIAKMELVVALILILLSIIVF